MVYTRPAHGDPFADSSATDATVIIDALADGLEAVETSNALKAALASPTFTGTPAAPTASAGTNTTQLATTAFVNTNTVRVTHPNTDDVLVEVYDKVSSRWQVTHYDSGWRNISYLLINSWTAGHLRIRRVGSRVHLSVSAITGVGTFTTSWIGTPPTGFVPGVAGFGHCSVMRESAVTGEAVWCYSTSSSINGYGGRIGGGAWSVGSAATGVLSYMTDEAIPGSLPGTLISAAPYA